MKNWMVAYLCAALLALGNACGEDSSPTGDDGNDEERDPSTADDGEDEGDDSEDDDTTSPSIDGGRDRDDDDRDDEDDDERADGGRADGGARDAGRAIILRDGGFDAGVRRDAGSTSSDDGDDQTGSSGSGDSNSDDPDSNDPGSNDSDDSDSQDNGGSTGGGSGGGLPDLGGLEDLFGDGGLLPFPLPSQLPDLTQLDPGAP